MNKKDLINQGIDYIMQHLDEKLTVDDIADHVHFSKYHFSRLFKETTGESIYAMIKRLKIDQSAVSMKLEKDKSITDIGLDFGYSSSNYSSAFKLRHHITPAEFRRAANSDNVANPFYSENTEGFGTFDDYAGKIQIREMPEIPVIYERMIGNYKELAQWWPRFMNTYKEYINTGTLLVERFYHDPSVTNLNQCICDLCVSVEDDCKLENKAVIKGGKFAAYRFEGRIADIFSKIQGVFSIWLPQSGYKMDENYGLNIYRKADQSEGYVILDLYIPIQ